MLPSAKKHTGVRFCSKKLNQDNEKPAQKSYPSRILTQPGRLCAWLYLIGGALNILSFIFPDSKMAIHPKTFISEEYAMPDPAKDYLKNLSADYISVNPDIKEIAEKIVRDSSNNPVEKILKKMGFNKFIPDEITVSPKDAGSTLIAAAMLINGLGILKLGIAMNQPSSILGGALFTANSPFMSAGVSAESLGVVYLSVAFFFAGLANNLEKRFGKNPESAREFDLSILRTLKNPGNWIKALSDSVEGKKIRKDIKEFILFIKEDQKIVATKTLQSFSQFYDWIKGTRKEKPDFMEINNPSPEQICLGGMLLNAGGALVLLTSGIGAAAGHFLAMLSSIFDNIGICTYVNKTTQNPTKSAIYTSCVSRMGAETMLPILQAIGSSPALVDIMVSLKIASFWGANEKIAVQTELESQ